MARGISSASGHSLKRYTSYLKLAQTIRNGSYALCNCARSLGVSGSYLPSIKCFQVNGVAIVVLALESQHGVEDHCAL
jgi:hypothetical protein